MAQSESNQVKRELKTRHLSMIALGGSIGTGLFVASGSAIATAGPGGAIAAYVGIGLMVFFLMTSLGEMATYVPVSGRSPSMLADLLIRHLGSHLVGIIGLIGQSRWPLMCPPPQS